MVEGESSKKYWGTHEGRRLTGGVIARSLSGKGAPRVEKFVDALSG